MTVECRVAGHRTVLAVSGEIDIASAPALRFALETALDAGPQELCVDLCATNVRRVLDLTGVVKAMRVSDAQPDA